MNLNRVYLINLNICETKFPRSDIVSCLFIFDEDKAG